MALDVPNALALATIADGSAIVASDHRNNYAAVQVGVNGLIAMFNLATAKGDLLVATAAGTFDRLPVGANGLNVAADSTQPLGMKWGAAAAPSDLAYVEFIANVPITATTAPTSQTVVSAGSYVFDGSAVWVEFYAARYARGTTQMTVNLWNDTTEIGVLGIVDTTQQIGGVLKRKVTPAAGAHTLAVKAYVDAGTGTVYAGAGTADLIVPGYIRIYKA